MMLTPSHPNRPGSGRLHTTWKPTPVLQSGLTLPVCAFAWRMTMPTDACQFFRPALPAVQCCARRRATAACSAPTARCPPAVQQARGVLRPAGRDALARCIGACRCNERARRRSGWTRSTRRSNWVSGGLRALVRTLAFAAQPHVDRKPPDDDHFFPTLPADAGVRRILITQPAAAAAARRVSRRCAPTRSSPPATRS